MVFGRTADGSLRRLSGMAVACQRGFFAFGGLASLGEAGLAILEDEAPGYYARYRGAEARKVSSGGRSRAGRKIGRGQLGIWRNAGLFSKWRGRGGRPDGVWAIAWRLTMPSVYDQLRRALLVSAQDVTGRPLAVN